LFAHLTQCPQRVEAFLVQLHRCSCCARLRRASVVGTCRLAPIRSRIPRLALQPPCGPSRRAQAQKAVAPVLRAVVGDLKARVARDERAHLYASRCTAKRHPHLAQTRGASVLLCVVLKKRCDGIEVCSRQPRVVAAAHLTRELDQRVWVLARHGE